MLSEIKDVCDEQENRHQQLGGACYHTKRPRTIHTAQRRRWYILIIGSIAYMCMHSYPYAIAVTVAFDTLVNMANVFFAGRPCRPPSRL